MTPARQIARTAALLLVAPLLSATAVALPTQHAMAVHAAEPDTDGDGIPDSGDGCPTVASSNPTGCPTASRQVSLRWLEAAKRLEAKVSSPVTACSARSRIVLWRVRPNRDFKLVAVNAAWSGRHRFTVPRGAGYYVTVSSSYSPGVAECAKAVSRTVRVPRS